MQKGDQVFLYVVEERTDKPNTGEIVRITAYSYKKVFLHKGNNPRVMKVR